MKHSLDQIVKHLEHCQQCIEAASTVMAKDIAREGYCSDHKIYALVDTLHDWESTEETR